jgi:hypothetical protein
MLLIGVETQGEFIQVSTGRLHSCGILIDETLECWGVGAPVKKPDGLFEQVSSGDFHSCAVLKDKSIQCWGETTQQGSGQRCRITPITLNDQVLLRAVSLARQPASSSRSAAARTFRARSRWMEPSSAGGRTHR